MKPMPDMNEFAQRCHVASEAKGWTNLNRTDAQTINLMVSENSEAVEDFRNKRGVDEIYYEVSYVESDEANAPKMVQIMSTAELSEFRENEGGSYRIKGAKPCGIPIELADTVIRIGQQCGTHGLDLRAHFGMVAGEGIVNREDFNAMLADATMYLSEAWRHSPQYNSSSPGTTISEGDDDMKYFFTRALARALTSITLFCTRHGIDLWAAVEEKMAYNETRPMLHGGKAI